MCFQGRPTEMTSALTPGQKGVQGQIGNQVSQGLKQGVTPYGGAMYAQPDQNQLAALNIIAQLMGSGPYKMGGFMGGGQQGTPQMPPGMPGGGGTPYGGTTPPTAGGFRPQGYFG